MVTLRRLIVKIHIISGLQALLSLILFSLSTIAVTVGSVTTPVTTIETFNGEVTENPIQVAHQIYHQVGHRFEKLPQQWMVSQTSDGIINIEFHGPQAVRDVSYNPTTNQIDILATPRSWLDFFNHMHQESLGRRNTHDSLWLWAWSLYLEISLLCLFILPLTSLYQFLTARTRGHFAEIVLLLSTGILTCFVVVLR